jgi:hypothetical protein
MCRDCWPLGLLIHPSYPKWCIAFASDTMSLSCSYRHAAKIFWMQTSSVSSFRSGRYHDGRFMLGCSPSLLVLTLKRSPKISLKGAPTYIRISYSQLFTNFYEPWITYWWIFSCEIAQHVFADVCHYIQKIPYSCLTSRHYYNLRVRNHFQHSQSVWHWLANPRFTWSNSGIGLGHLAPLTSRPGSDRLQRLAFSIYTLDFAHTPSSSTDNRTSNNVRCRRHRTCILLRHISLGAGWFKLVSKTLGQPFASAAAAWSSLLPNSGKYFQSSRSCPVLAELQCLEIHIWFAQRSGNLVILLVAHVVLQVT